MSNYYNMPKLPTEASPKVEIFVDELSGLKLLTYVIIRICRCRVTAVSAW